MSFAELYINQNLTTNTQKIYIFYERINKNLLSLHYKDNNKTKNRMGKIISVAGQKGGCGKSSITVLLASMLAYKFGKKVLVIDADSTQHTLQNCREDDISAVYDGRDAKNAGFSLSNKTKADIYEAYLANRGESLEPYEIMEVPMEPNAIGEQLARKKDYDFVIVDMPGSVENEWYFSIVSKFDVVFVPFTVDTFVFNSNFPYAQVLQNVVMKAKGSNLNKIYWFWNRYVENEGKELRARMEKIIKEQLPEVEPLKEWLGDSRAMLRPSCRSTLFTPVGKYAAYGNFSACVEEMCNKIM